MWSNWLQNFLIFMIYAVLIGGQILLFVWLEHTDWVCQKQGYSRSNVSLLILDYYCEE